MEDLLEVSRVVQDPEEVLVVEVCSVVDLHRQKAKATPKEMVENCLEERLQVAKEDPACPRC